MHEQVDVVVLAVEFAQLRSHGLAHAAHGLLAVVQHRAGKHTAPILGDEDKMDMKVE
ncbi:hypothetical protein GCM10027440_29030 [Nocardiopsis coralliicola]